MNEDWKGESLIRRRPTKAEQYARGQSAVQVVAHKKRQAEGTNMSRIGPGWAARIRSAVIEASTGGGE